MKSNIKAIDFFCSGGGMSYGMSQAGIDVIAGIDIDFSCKETYEANLPDSKFIHADITKLHVTSLKEQTSITKYDDRIIFIGCSPCQFWTKLNTDKTKSDKTKNLLKDFERFVLHYLPGYVIVENVPGILSKKKESGLNLFVKNLESVGYKVEYKTINLNNYGVPQSRKRFSLIANRLGIEKLFPGSDEEPLPLVRDFIGKQNGFPEIEAGYKDNTNFMHSASALSEKNLARLRMTKKDGGTRSDWADTDLQLKTYKKRNNKSFSDVYGRMSWDKPAPTITTKFNSLSNGRFGHPEEDRAISIREGATLQTFPKNFTFKTTSIINTARMIGNAVPPEYAKKIGRSILKATQE